MIRRGEVTSREVVEVHIEHIERVNPGLNAIVADRFEAARQEAQQADSAVAANGGEDLPPLHGVPCTIKECFALQGMPNTSGLVSRIGLEVKENATAVARLKAAGAIPLGVTNTPELCMWFETFNRVYGRTNNPYDRRRTAGGSSGGEGAIIGAGGSPLGLGSDVGGSIRLPAFFNGIFGHKPTGGMVPGTGQFPIAENEALRYLTTGPLSRRAEDLMPLLRIMAGPDGKDQGCRAFELKDPAMVRIENLTVLNVTDNGAIRVSPDLRETQRRCASALEEKGAQVKEVRIDRLKKSFDIWSAMLSDAGGTPFTTLLGGGAAVNPFWELLKWTIRRSSHTVPAIVLVVIEKMLKYTPGRVRRLVRMGQELRSELLELITPSVVMLYPSFHRPAPFHYLPLLRPFDAAYTAIINVMELPSTQVPLGLNKKGLPLGLQVVGLRGYDHVTIAVAMELEKHFGGWTPPWQA